MSNNGANGNQYAAQSQLVRVSAGQFKDKFQSKKEVYRFLTHDNGIYLPKYENVTIFHMRDLVAERRSMKSMSSTSRFHSSKVRR